MLRMSSIICNKCFAPISRGACPYRITQCGHISCQDCLQQVKKQCPQCQSVSTTTFALEEPFPDTLENMEILLKMDSALFSINQLNITMRRFHDLDEKYEVLKTKHWLKQHNLKALKKKYVSLKEEKDELDKRLLSSNNVEELLSSESDNSENSSSSG